MFPRDTSELEAVAAACREHDAPLTVRGAGTSVAGNAVGPGVVVDTSRHLRRIIALDPDAATATVEPGVVLDALQAAAAPHRLRFGPDPSTHSRCSIGGMIGNNACGAHALAYGTTAANVVSLDVVDGAGRRWLASAGAPPPEPLAGFAERVVRPIAGELGRFGRQVSGYGLHHLLPEHGADLAKALVGTEGTVAVVLRATVALHPVPAATALAVLGYPDMATAADASPALAALGPLALEGIDARMVEMLRASGRPAPGIASLPAGGAWLFAETGGQDPREAAASSAALVRAAGAGDSRVVTDRAIAAALWRIREDGVGLAGRSPRGEQAWPAWEDAAVPPESLGAYLRDFGALLGEHRLDGISYGHFGDGCVHVRIDLPLAEHPERLRPFVTDAAALVARYGGSLSGEHGDGRARSELLGAIYSPRALAAFAELKAILDPAGILNPGVVVKPAPLDVDLRRPSAARLATPGGFALHADRGSLTDAVHRCVGVGKCRADNSASGGFMCPSYLATGDEKDSTRGRARVLQELANGTLVSGGWRSAEVREALDLCLGCKACASDCPASVDMATYRSEVLHQAYRRRRRPASHYSLGWLPRWLRVAEHFPAAANAASASRPLSALAKRVAGIDPRRPLPRLAGRPPDPDAIRAAATAGAGAGAGAGGSGAGGAVLWIDTFTRAFSPRVATAAASLLGEAGFEVEVSSGDACCAITWISTGQLDAARRRLRSTVASLAPHAEAGRLIVGLEPSCTAVLRSDLVELLPGDTRAAAVAGATTTLAEALTVAAGGAAPGWLAGRLAGARVVAQPHCHHHAVMGWEADLSLLSAAGAEVARVGGCCGLAGNFGMERGHYEVSTAVAANGLLRALEVAGPGALLAADGFSCRTQADHLAGARGMHLAELLAGG